MTGIRVTKTFGLKSNDDDVDGGNDDDDNWTMIKQQQSLNRPDATTECQTKSNKDMIQLREDRQRTH